MLPLSTPLGPYVTRRPVNNVILWQDNKKYSRSGQMHKKQKNMKTHSIRAKTHYLKNRIA